MTFTQIRLQSLLNLGRMGFHPLFGQELIDRAFRRTEDSRLSEDAVVRARLEQGLAQGPAHSHVGHAAAPHRRHD